MGLTKLYKLKEYAKQEVQSSTAVATLHNTSLSVPRTQVEYLYASLRVITNEDLATITLYLKKTLL